MNTNAAISPKERYLNLVQQKIELNNRMLAMLPSLSVEDQKKMLPKVEASILETQKMMANVKSE